MNTYEFFGVITPEYTETEVNTLVSTIKQALIDAGASDIAVSNMGKQRLAYVFPKKQHHGTYVLLTFVILPENVQMFKDKVRFVKGIVRSVIRVYKKDEKKSSVARDTMFVSSRKKEPVLVVASSVSEPFVPEVAIRTASEEQIVVRPVGQSSPSKVVLSQEELDKRIDALLNAEITPDSI